MKIDITTDVIVTGMVMKEKFIEVTLKVQLSEEEKAIIKENSLDMYVIMNREEPANKRSNIHNNLLYKDLVAGVDKYTFKLPSEAKYYVENLTERLKKAKDLLSANTTLPADVSLEL